MIDQLRYTLISDGSSDVVLKPILNWLLRDCGIQAEIKDNWADPRIFRNPPKDLSQKIIKAIEIYPCELLFIHRDSERETREKRCSEIEASCEMIANQVETPPRICVVPVRMLEAWLLFDEQAIRIAAGNPKGTENLTLPSLHSVEQQPDPKVVLHQALRQASGLRGRRAKKFPVNKRVHRLVEIIEDFSPLLELSAFSALRHDLKDVIKQEKWVG